MTRFTFAARAMLADEDLSNILNLDYTVAALWQERAAGEDISIEGITVSCKDLPLHIPPRLWLQLGMAVEATLNAQLEHDEIMQEKLTAAAWVEWKKQTREIT